MKNKIFLYGHLTCSFCILSAIIGLNSPAWSGPNDLLPGKYELDMAARPPVPYAVLDNYTPDLSSSGRGAANTVPVSRHHIIPFNVLRSFYNNVVNRPGEQLRLRSFFLQLSTNIPFYALSGGADCAAHHQDYELAMTLSEAMAYNTVRSGSARYAPGLETFQEFYAWLPGNLFIGPQNRSDDPGDQFESHAAVVVGRDSFAILSRVYGNMLRYNNGDITVLNSIASDLTRIAGRRSVYTLVSQNWVRDGSTYRLRNEPNVLDGTENPPIRAYPTECNELTSNYHREIGKYMSLMINGFD